MRQLLSASYPRMLTVLMLLSFAAAGGNCALWLRCGSLGVDMENGPEDLLRSMFGDEGPAEPRPPRTGTPLFQLSRALPEFAAETRRILLRCDEAELADQVDDLWIYDRCRCGMEECATVYTAKETAPRARSAWRRWRVRRYRLRAG